MPQNYGLLSFGYRICPAYFHRAVFSFFKNYKLMTFFSNSTDSGSFIICVKFLAKSVNHACTVTFKVPCNCYAIVVISIYLSPIILRKNGSPLFSSIHLSSSSRQVTIASVVVESLGTPHLRSHSTRYSSLPPHHSRSSGNTLS